MLCVPKCIKDHVARGIDKDGRGRLEHVAHPISSSEASTILSFCRHWGFVLIYVEVPLLVDRHQKADGRAALLLANQLTACGRVRRIMVLA